MTIYKTITGAYDDFMASGDPRVTPLPLMNSPAAIVGLIVSYLLFVKSIGPALMKNKEPFDLRNLMIPYNALLVLSYSYILIPLVQIIWKALPRGICNIQDVSENDALRLVELGWWFFFTKVVELADTVFFVLRKKFNHISGLHLLHHSIVPVVTWIGLRIEPTGTHFFCPIFNSFIHILMYTYYILAALGPSVQKYLWWKKYLTILQIVQFVAIIVYTSVLAAADCKLSKFIITMTLFSSALFLAFFIKFYQNSYLKRKRVSTKVD